MNLRTYLDLQYDLLRRDLDDFDAEVRVDIRSPVQTRNAVFVHWDSVEVGR